MSLLFWFTRDLRLDDHEGLEYALARTRDAGSNGAALKGILLLDEAEYLGANPLRRASALASYTALAATAPFPVRLVLGSDSTDCLNQLKQYAIQEHAREVVATRSFDPAGMAAQARVRESLAEHGIRLTLIGSNYLHAPGLVTRPNGEPYRVFTPYFREWMRQTAPTPIVVQLTSIRSHASPSNLPTILGSSVPLVRAGQAYALQTLERFASFKVGGYEEHRDRPDLAGTSQISHALSHGEVHPRTVFHMLANLAGAEAFLRQLAWRDFYADILFHNPDSLWRNLDRKFDELEVDEGELANERFAAWCAGRTGYPLVDAGMRQLARTGWMHNRVRMLVASFLIKDLHLPWQKGAAWFAQNLTDYDPASNAHGWQWVAGSGTDASPYYRVFNPVLQARKFDPNGDYVRRHLPELAHIDGGAVHEPWLLSKTLVSGYPTPIVDHARERLVALARYEAIKGARARQ